MASAGTVSSRCETAVSRAAVPTARAGLRCPTLSRLPRGRWSHGTPCRKVAPQATPGDKSSYDFNTKFDEVSKDLSDKWEATEDKPVAVAVALGCLVALYTLNGVVGSVERVPLFGFLFELVGILVTGWFSYRYLVFESDRDELKQSIDDFLDKVSGK